MAREGTMVYEERPERGAPLANQAPRGHLVRMAPWRRKKVRLVHRVQRARTDHLEHLEHLARLENQALMASQASKGPAVAQAMRVRRAQMESRVPRAKLLAPSRKKPS